MDTEINKAADQEESRRKQKKQAAAKRRSNLRKRDEKENSKQNYIENLMNPNMLQKTDYKLKKTSKKSNQLEIGGVVDVT